jgi:hypothetical protein
MGKQEQSEPDIEITDMWEPGSKPEPAETDGTVSQEEIDAFVADLMAQAEKMVNAKDGWSEPIDGPPAELDELVTDRKDIVADGCHSVSVFFAEPNCKIGSPELLGFSFHKGHQELRILFSEEMWIRFNGVITDSIKRRNAMGDRKPWGGV